MNTGSNSIMKLLYRGRTTPAGWGFPPVNPALVTQSALRSSLCFLEDEDGYAQLSRWYFSIIRQFPAVYRSLAGDHEGYPPSMWHKPLLDSTALTFYRSYVTGSLTLDWIPDPSTRSLTGSLAVSSYIISEASLSLGETVYPVQLQATDDSGIYELSLPEFFNCRAAAGQISPGGEYQIVFRPSSFDATALVESLTLKAASDIDRAGLLDSFLSLPRLVDKLAVAWLALSVIEEPSQ